MQDRLVISITDEKGLKQFSMPKKVTKFIFIGIVIFALLFFVSFLTMNFLMNQINRIAIQKNNALAQYHSIYQKNAILQDIVREKSNELATVNSKIDQLEDIVSIKSSNFKEPQISKVNLQNLSKDQKILLLNLIPNGDPLKDFNTKVVPTDQIRFLKNVNRAERGVDYIVTKKTPVYATADGVIVLVQKNGKTGFGNFIRIIHSFGFSSTYARLSDIVVKRGDFIQKGQIIAYTDDTGRYNTDKLYYEVRFLNNFLNPFHYSDWSIDNFDVIFQEQDGIDWQNLAWAIEDISRLQTFRVSITEKFEKESL